MRLRYNGQCPQFMAMSLEMLVINLVAYVMKGGCRRNREGRGINSVPGKGGSMWGEQRQRRCERGRFGEHTKKTGLLGGAFPEQNAEKEIGW